MFVLSLGALIDLMLPAVAALVVVAVHVWVGRTFPRIGVYRALLAGAVAGLCVLAALKGGALISGINQGGAAVANAIIYGCFCYVYFHFNNMGETARRVRLLREMASASRPLTYDEILARYNAEEILGRRLSRLLGAQQITRSGDRLYITDRSIYLMAWSVNLARGIIFGPDRRNPPAQ
jgi:hypothetical protein